MKLIKKVCMLVVTAFAVNKANAAAMCVNKSALSNMGSPMAAYHTSNEEYNYNGWGNSWAVLHNGSLIEGIAVCINDGTDDGRPATQLYGSYCWCRVTKPVLGPRWAFALAHDSHAKCTAACAYACASCVYTGSDNSCTRAELLPS
jgi:hypothetical protein